MIGFGYQCRRAQKDLVRQDELDAFERAKLEIHLRRCERCRVVAQEIEFIENLSIETDELTDRQCLEIFNRLVPAVNELSVEPSSKWYVFKQYFALKPAVALGSVFAVILLLVAAVIFSLSTDPTAEQSAPTFSSTMIESSKPVDSNIVVSRLEGVVSVDDQVMTPIEKSTIRSGARVVVGKNGRFSFSVEDLASFALFSDTEWKVTKASRKHLTISLEKGSLSAQFNGNHSRLLEISTPDSLVRVKGTIFTVEVLPEGGTRVGVIKGLVEVISLRGTPKSFELAHGQVALVPGADNITEITEVQRALAQEMERISDLHDDSTSLVRFDGTPEQVKVEVGGRLLGTTPLAIRLPEGELAYNLTSPGMEPVSGIMSSNPGTRNISFSMVPTKQMDPDILEPEPLKRSVKKRAKTRRILLTNEEDTSWDFFSRAQAAMTAGDIPYAIGLLNRSLEEVTGKRRIASLSLLAECHAAMGSYAKAADIFDIIADELPRNAIAQNARYEVGRLSMDQLGDLPRARAAFTAYVASPLGGALKEEAFYSLCQLDGREGAHRNAFYCFNEFLRTFPGGHHEPDARLWRGALYQDLDRRFADAERDLLFFLKKRPHHPRADEALYRVIVGRYSVGDYRGSMRKITEYLNNHPKGRFRVRVERLKRAILESGFSN